MSGLKVFCSVDGGMLSFTAHWRSTQGAAGKQRQRAGEMWPSEIMTILVHVHQSQYRTFQASSTEYVQVHLTSEFPHLVSSTRFVARIPHMMVLLRASVQSSTEPARASAS